MGPKAPKDAEAKTPCFYIMRNKEVAGNRQPDGTNIQYLYMNDGRMISAAQIVGSVTDQTILKLLETTEGFRKLVKKIGVTVESDDSETEVGFHFQMYGKEDPYGTGSTLYLKVKANAMEEILSLDQHAWNGEEDIPGQIRFSFPKENQKAKVSVRFYLKEGFTAPEPAEEKRVDTTSYEYKDMISHCIMHEGNPRRIQNVIKKAKNGEKVTIAAIGGSITQGAGAVPINTECYTRKFYEGFLKATGAQEENVQYIKAGVGGTPSELGMIRYEADVLEEGTPDLVIVEFAVNDAGDETGGACYESLIKRILLSENEPAVLLIFAVFANDWNLQERLIPIARAYNLPTVSVKNAVSPQFNDPKKRIITRNHYFYDRYHPTNLGHTIMADCLLYLLNQCAGSEPTEEIDTKKVPPVVGDTFTDIKLLDRKHIVDKAIIQEGSFHKTGGPKQLVERNMNLVGTPEFDFNWYYDGTDTIDTFRPFTLKAYCKAVLIVMLDSASPDVGQAKVLVDGKEVLNYDPHEIGWTHNNAVICLNEPEPANHTIEIYLADEQCDKTYTIAGFGIVQ